MDPMFNIRERLFAGCQDRDFRPRVHAELMLLEYFYSDQLEFVDDGRFITRVLLLLQYHYISQHPGGFVRPSSPGIRYRNWLPRNPILQTGKNKFTDGR